MVNAVLAEDSSSVNVKPFFIANICNTSSGLLKITNSEGVSFLTRGEYFNNEEKKLFFEAHTNAKQSGLQENIVDKYISIEKTQLTEDLLGILLNAVRTYSAEIQAMAYLNRAEHSRFQLEIKLKKKSFSSTEIRLALDYLSAQGFLDDARFARAWLNTRHINKKEGRWRLASELALRGISFDIANKALDDFFSENSEREICYKALKKQMRKYSDKTKLVRSMQKLGFSVRLINICLEGE